MESLTNTLVSTATSGEQVVIPTAEMELQALNACPPMEELLGAAEFVSTEVFFTANHTSLDAVLEYLVAEQELRTKYKDTKFVKDRVFRLKGNIKAIEIEVDRLQGWDNLSNDFHNPPEVEELMRRRQTLRALEDIDETVGYVQSRNDLVKREGFFGRAAPAENFTTDKVTNAQLDQIMEQKLHYD